MISNVFAFLAIAMAVAYGLPCGGLVSTGCSSVVLPTVEVLGGSLLETPLVGCGCVTGIGAPVVTAPAIAAPVFTTGVVEAGLGYGLGAGTLGCGLAGGLVTSVC